MTKKQLVSRAKRRGGLGRTTGMSQYAVARELGISRARVKQIEANAMRKLRALKDVP